MTAKICSCGRAFTWAEASLAGYVYVPPLDLSDAGQLHELRNCPACRSTRHETVTCAAVAAAARGELAGVAWTLDTARVSRSAIQALADALEDSGWVKPPEKAPTPTKDTDSALFRCLHGKMLEDRCLPCEAAIREASTNNRGRKRRSG